MNLCRNNLRSQKGDYHNQRDYNCRLIYAIVGCSATLDELERELTAHVRKRSRWTLADQPDAVEVHAVDAPDSDGRLSKHFDLQSLIAGQRQVAVVWEVDDVLVIRPDFTDVQAWEVLQHAHQEHDAEIGLNWHSREATTTARFGPEPELKESYT